MSVPVVRSPRVQQLEGLFDVPPTQRSEFVRDVHLPLEERPWRIGLIVGRSGSGKSTVARHFFGDALISGFEWPQHQSIVDAFPRDMSIKEITGVLSSVGFSSPPSWLRPFRCLSNGEQFRVTLARALAEPRPLVVIDEFTSVVDRTVAQIGSAAISRAIRRLDRQFVAVSCHYDIIDWLDPDWTYEPETDVFHWRLERRRPPIALTIVRVHHSAWQLFRRYHYLTGTLNKNAYCFAALYRGQPVAFTSVIHSVNNQKTYWRGHRTVCLPDFQGVGIGNALAEFVASLFAATGKKYCSTTGNPAMIAHRRRSPLWRMHRLPGMTSPVGRSAKRYIREMFQYAAVDRITAGFTYVGPARVDEARRFGLPVQETSSTRSSGTENSPHRPRYVTGSRSLRTRSSTKQKWPAANGSRRKSNAQRVPQGTTSTSSATATSAPPGSSAGSAIPSRSQRTRADESDFSPA
jgi:GNAT superfamily N-acetyltransferase